MPERFDLRDDDDQLRAADDQLLEQLQLAAAAIRVRKSLFQMLQYDARLLAVRDLRPPFARGHVDRAKIDYFEDGALRTDLQIRIGDEQTRSDLSRCGWGRRLRRSSVQPENPAGEPPHEHPEQRQREGDNAEHREPERPSLERSDFG